MNRVLLPKPEKPKLVRRPSEGRNTSGDDIGDHPPADDEEEKKKFKPENFEWYELSETPETFPQFFNEMHDTEKVSFCSNPSSPQCSTLTPTTS